MSGRLTLLRQKASVLRCPTAMRMQPWVLAALDAAGHKAPVALTIRFVDEDEGLSLNQQYRYKKYATNVLSFPYDEPVLPEDRADFVEHRYLGDLVICMPVVLHEAATQRKTPAAHTAHLVVHGVLHLLGYDHQTDTEAENMERIEVNAMHRLGFENPYIAD